VKTWEYQCAAANGGITLPFQSTRLVAAVAEFGSLAGSYSMSTVHPLLRGKANILIVVLWGLIIVALFFVLRPFPWLLLLLGLCCGGWGGFMQLRSISESKAAYLSSSTLLGVERALKSTRWGKFYLIYLFVCVACFFAAGLLLYRNLYTGALAYTSMAFVRECVTLKSSFTLEKGAKDGHMS
jgi:hypothetical protein